MKRSAWALLFLLVVPQLSADCPVTPPAPQLCETQDWRDIRDALNAAAAAGGGTVQLQGRRYVICQTLQIPSNVHLRGAGRGATIIQNSTSPRGITVDNAYVNASIAAIGKTNMSISDLTVDHATCSTNANGIAFMPAGVAGQDPQLYNGTLPTNGLIERVEILGTPGLHSYLIWNFKGTNIKILNNWVDGRSTGNSAQEGIESFGGQDVVIANNTVKGVGGAGINLGSAEGIANADTKGLFITNNHVTYSRFGITLGTASGQSNSDTHIRGNTITNAREVGIAVRLAANTTERGLHINNNTIRDVGETTSNGAAAVEFRNTGGVGTTAFVHGATIESNHIQNVRGTNGTGVKVLYVPNVRIVNNTIIDTTNESIYTYDVTDLEVVGNRIERTSTGPTGTIPVAVYRSSLGDISRFTIERNRIEWLGQNAAVMILSAGASKKGTVRDNIFRRTDTAQPTPIVTDSPNCGVWISRNITWYSTSWSNPSEPPPACP